MKDFKDIKEQKATSNNPASRTCIGKWTNEPDEVKMVHIESGYSCEILRTSIGHLCGYVSIPEDHTLHGKSYSEVHGIDVHGGLTYSGCGEDNTWIFGFDCAHLYDLTPYNTDSHGTYRDIDYVAREVSSLASQLKAIDSTVTEKEGTK